MNWNHRIIDLGQNGDPWLAVKEVYYNDDGTLMGYAAICDGSEDMAGLRKHLRRMLKATEQPVLKAGDFPGGAE